MKNIKLFFLLLLMVASCVRDKDTGGTATNVSAKRQKIIEVAQKYQNPSLGLTIQKDAKLENLSDEMIEKFDLKLFEQCLQNLTRNAQEFDAKQATMGCKALNDKKWSLAKPDSHEAFLEFMDHNKIALTTCDSLSKIRQEALQNAMQPCNQLTEMLMKVNTKN